MSAGRTEPPQKESDDSAHVAAAARALLDDEIRNTVNRLGSRFDDLKHGIKLELDPMKADLRRALAIVESITVVVGKIDRDLDENRDLMRAAIKAVADTRKRLDVIEERNDGIDRERARLTRKLDSLTEEVDEVREVTGSGRHVPVTDAGAVLAQAIALEGNATEHRKSLEAELTRERARASDLEARLIGRQDKATERRFETWKIVLTTVLGLVTLAGATWLANQAGQEKGRRHRDHGAETPQGK